jgi:transcriptional regulator with XRE-family HTH domain
MIEKPPNSMEHWGKRLTRVLQEKGISQKKAASIAGVGKSAVSSWTAGGSPSNLAAVKRLCDALEICFTWLLTGAEVKNEGRLQIAGNFDKEFSFDGYARIRIDVLAPKSNKDKDTS